MQIYEYNKGTKSSTSSSIFRFIRTTSIEVPSNTILTDEMSSTISLMSILTSALSFNAVKRKPPLPKIRAMNDWSIIMESENECKI